VDSHVGLCLASTVQGSLGTVDRILRCSQANGWWEAVSIAALLLFSGSVWGQANQEDATAVLELGGAAERSLKGSSSSFGPTIAVEITPVENWLELEAGVSSFSSQGTREWDFDPSLQKALDVV
jgi:hypothetical protein